MKIIRRLKRLSESLEEEFASKPDLTKTYEHENFLYKIHQAPSGKFGFEIFHKDVPIETAPFISVPDSIESFEQAKQDAQSAISRYNYDGHILIK